MMRSRRLIVLFALMLSAVAAGAVSAAGLRATLEVDRAWLGSDDDVVAAVTITNDSDHALEIRYEHFALLTPGGVVFAALPPFQVTGVALEADALAKLGTELRRTCGSGGTVKDGTIEIQGDHADALVAELGKRGFKAKRAGG